MAYTWDVFICHASEDKKDVVERLAVELRRRGLRVWYDDWTVQIGDSLRRKIDEGLAKSRFGIVVLSPHFFEKQWPQHELDGLVQREMQGTKVILPIWHNVGHNEVAAYSLPLTDRVAGTTEQGVPALVDRLILVLAPGASVQPKRETRKRILKRPILWGAVTIIVLAALLILRVLVEERRSFVLKWATTPYAPSAEIENRFRAPFDTLGVLVPQIKFRLHPPVADYQALYASLVSDAIDITGFSPYTFVQKRLDIERTPYLEVIGKTDGNPMRTSALVVRSDSPLRSLGDLRSPNGVTFVFGPPWSTSRSVIPQLVLREAGVPLDGRIEHVSKAEIIEKVLSDDKGLTVGALYSDDITRGMRFLLGSEFPMPTEVVVVNTQQLEKHFGQNWKVELLPRLQDAMESISFVYPLDEQGARDHVRPLEEFLYSPVLIRHEYAVDTWIAELLVDDRWELAKQIGHRIPYAIYRRSISQPADQAFPNLQWELVGTATILGFSGDQFEVITDSAARIGDHIFPPDNAPGKTTQ